MTTVYRNDGGRELPAKHGKWKCGLCKGKIHKSETYVNYRTDHKGNRNWQVRRHLTCQAAWWQVDDTNVLEALAALPVVEHDGIFDLTLVGVQLYTKGDPLTIGSVSWSPPTKMRTSLVHTRKKGLKKAVEQQIGIGFKTLAEAYMAALNNPEIAYRLSHQLQQIAQLTKNKSLTT